MPLVTQAASAELFRADNHPVHIGFHSFSATPVLLKTGVSFTQTLHDQLESTGQLWLLPNKTSDDIAIHLSGRLTPAVLGGYDVSATLSRQGDAFWTQHYHADTQQLLPLAFRVSSGIYHALFGRPAYFNEKIVYAVQYKNMHSRGLQSAQYALKMTTLSGVHKRTVFTSAYPIILARLGPQEKRVAFVAYMHGSMGVYVYHLDSDVLQAISVGAGVHSAPSWSPDGTKIVFSSSSEAGLNLFVDNLSTGEISQLTSGFFVNTAASWSPDGKRLVFTSTRGGTPQVYIDTLATHDIQRVTFVGQYNASPVFFDNTHIVFMRQLQDSQEIVWHNVRTGSEKILAHAVVAYQPQVVGQRYIRYITQFAGKHVMVVRTVSGNIRWHFVDSTGNVL